MKVPVSLNHHALAEPAYRCFCRLGFSREMAVTLPLFSLWPGFLGLAESCRSMLTGRLLLGGRRSASLEHLIKLWPFNNLILLVQFFEQLGLVLLVILIFVVLYYVWVFLSPQYFACGAASALLPACPICSLARRSASSVISLGQRTLECLKCSSRLLE